MLDFGTYAQELGFSEESAKSYGNTVMNAQGRQMQWR